MKSVQGTVKSGRIALSEPIAWPEGTVVRIKPVESKPLHREPENKVPGISGQFDESDDAESIRRWIEQFDAIPPLQMTAREEAEWQAARCHQRDLERAAKLHGTSDLEANSQ
jgi:hypothetical protein